MTAQISINRSTRRKRGPTNRLLASKKHQGSTVCLTDLGNLTEHKQDRMAERNLRWIVPETTDWSEMIENGDISEI